MKSKEARRIVMQNETQLLGGKATGSHKRKLPNNDSVSVSFQQAKRVIRSEQDALRSNNPDKLSDDASIPYCARVKVHFAEVTEFTSDVQDALARKGHVPTAMTKKDFQIWNLVQGVPNAIRLAVDIRVQ